MKKCVVILGILVVIISSFFWMRTAYISRVYLDSEWEYAGESVINSGCAVLYRAHSNSRGIVIGINAGHGTGDDSDAEAFCYPDHSPGNKGEPTYAGVERTTSLEAGMDFNDGTPESAVTLRMAEKLRKLLLDEGYDVLMVRDREDVQLDDIARTVICNNTADCHISLHWDSDGLSYDKGSFFCSVPVAMRGMEPVSRMWKEHTRLGSCLIEGLRDSGEVIFGNGALAADLIQTSYSTIPTVDIELGNQCSNHSEDVLYNKAVGIVKGINEFFSTFISSADNTSYLYTNAERMLVGANKNADAVINTNEGTDSSKMQITVNEDLEIGAIGTTNYYQCRDQFCEDDIVNVYAGGVRIDPEEYDLYKQGKVVFHNDVSYEPEDVLFEYTSYTQYYDDVENELSSNVDEFYKVEQYGEDKYAFVDDPSGGPDTVLRLGVSGISATGADRFRIQFDRQVELTEYTDEVKVYFPQALIAGLATFDYENGNWFSIGGLWAQFGSNTTGTTDMYSGCGISLSLYKDSESNQMCYMIRRHKRTVADGNEVYTGCLDIKSDIVVQTDTWVTIRKHVVVGNPGYIRVTIIDDNGTHEIEGHIPIGVVDPENESILYGERVISDIPYRMVTIVNGFKIYTSTDIANSILNSEGELVLYFKDYKCYDQKNVNAHDIVPITMS